MAGTDNADVKWRENKVVGEDSWRTANCLRGRLLAERMASKNAREEAEQLGIRLLEVERLLKQEAKSRNKAERKLKFLMKKLECMNIPYVADESEESVSSEKTTDFYSVSSTASSRTENVQLKISAGFGSQQGKEIVECLNLEEINDSQLSLWSLKNDECEMGSNENSNSSAGEPHSIKPVQMNSTRDEQRMESYGDEDDRYSGDNLMAIVPVDMATEDERIDPEVLDATVKEVLESLRRAKEQLQSSMERRRMGISMIKVG